MKLNLENTNAPWIRQAFAVAAKLLKIEDAPWEVNVRLEPEGVLPPKSGGTTGFDPKLPNKVVIQLIDRPDPFQRIGMSYSPFEVFCHELIHVKQHIKDGLIGDLERGGSWWQGKFWSDRDQAIACMLAGGPDGTPWEKEAYGKMLDLAEAVKAKL